MAVRRQRLSPPRDASLADRSPLGLDAAAAGDGITPVFQPIVSLTDGETVGFEALARWPGLHDCPPAHVFRHAAAIGSVDALDQACIDSALAAALKSDLRRGALLCVNAEPSSPYVGRADDAVLALAHDQLTVMFEITERNLLAHPRALLEKVAAMRADGFAIALDDVGAQPGSLAILDVIQPDVIKLDLGLVQTQPSYAQARTLAAILAHHERTDAVILAEGIETDEHLEQALAVGADLGQGYLFGRPGPLALDTTATWSPTARIQHRSPSTLSPFALFAGTAPVRTARKQTLMALTRHVESQAGHAADPPMVLTALQHDDNFRGATRDRYGMLASTCPLVVVFGREVAHDLGSGVRGVGLHPADPMCAEWLVVVLGPHLATALIAREHDDRRNRSRPDGDRRFDFILTYDRSLVTEVTRDLLHRMP